MAPSDRVARCVLTLVLMGVSLLALAGCAMDHRRPRPRRDGGPDSGCYNPAALLCWFPAPESPHLCVSVAPICPDGACPEPPPGTECWCYDDVVHGDDPTCECFADGWHCGTH